MVTWCPSGTLPAAPMERRAALTSRGAMPVAFTTRSSGTSRRIMVWKPLACSSGVSVRLSSVASMATAAWAAE